MSRWVNREGFPAKGKKGWDVLRAKAFRETLQENRNGGPQPTDRTRADVELRTQRARLVRIKADEAEGKYVSAADVSKRFDVWASVLRQSIEEWIDVLPQLVASEDGARLKDELNDRYDRLCLQLQAIEATPDDDLPTKSDKSRAAYRRHRR